MKSVFTTFIGFFLIGTSFIAEAQEDKSYLYSAEITGTFSGFEQQIKTEIGGIKGELLTSDSELSLQAIGTYHVWKFISVGWYFQYDSGNRESAQFSGFDAQGAAEVINLQGGAYTEIWTGPLVRASYKQAFFEFGYGLLGTRTDDARIDLFNEAGSNEGSLTVDPSVAWLLGIGAQVHLCDDLSLLLKAQYRVRYYDSRDGEKLQNEMVHGTQNFSPMIGLSYRL